MNMPKPLRLVILLTVVGVAAYFAFQSVSRPPDPESVGRTETIGVSGPGVRGGENPLGSGGEISLETATSLIRRCSCPQLPPSGPLSLERVEAAWTDSSGQLLLEYDDGVRLYYVPDGRTEDTYVADWTQAISDGWPGTIIPLRQTGAAAAERDEEGPAPHSAVVTWLEGPYHLAMHGDGGQSLAELIQLAESLPKATVAATITEGELEVSDPPTGGERTDPASGGAMFTFDNPLGPFAVKIPLELATRLIARCHCPELPDSGAATAEHVTAAYTDELAQIGLILDNGLRLTYSPDDRTPRQYADQWAEVIADGTWPGSLVPLRGVMAAARDLDERGPAIVSWIEGAHDVQLYSKGEHRLPELLAIAEAMPSGTT
jgi:predicted RNase H-like HicB family nuclease